MENKTNPLEIAAAQSAAVAAYAEQAIKLNVMKLEDHENVMDSLKEKAIEHIRQDAQSHMDEHFKDQTTCESLNSLCDQFYITKDLVTGRVRVGEVRVDAFTK